MVTDSLPRMSSLGNPLGKPENHDAIQSVVCTHKSCHAARGTVAVDTCHVTCCQQNENRSLQYAPLPSRNQLTQTRLQTQTIPAHNEQHTFTTE